MNHFGVLGIVLLVKFSYDIWSKAARWKIIASATGAMICLSLSNSRIAAGLSIAGNMALIVSIFSLSGILSWILFGIAQDIVLTKGKNFESKVKKVHPFISAFIASIIMMIVLNSIARAHNSFPESSKAFHEFVRLLGHPLFQVRFLIVLLSSAILGSVLGLYKKSKPK